MAENPAWAKLGGQPGLCLNCCYATVNETRRGTAYLRCRRSAWDGRLVRYPRLPVTECVGFEAVMRGLGGTNHHSLGHNEMTETGSAGHGLRRGDPGARRGLGYPAPGSSGLGSLTDKWALRP